MNGIYIYTYIYIHIYIYIYISAECYKSRQGYIPAIPIVVNLYTCFSSFHPSSFHRSVDQFCCWGETEGIRTTGLSRDLGIKGISKILVKHDVTYVHTNYEKHVLYNKIYQIFLADMKHHRNIRERNWYHVIVSTWWRKHMAIWKAMGWNKLEKKEPI